MASPPPDAKYPDTIAIAYDEEHQKLTSIYNDHSVYVWDVYNIKRVGKSYSFLYHSACIWGVEMAPPNSPLPPGTFLTCSSDDTIRVWTLDKMNEANSRGIYRKNVYSNVSTGFGKAVFFVLADEVVEIQEVEFKLQDYEKFSGLELKA